MSEFIYTSSGFINLAHVALIRVGWAKEEGLDLIQMSDGRIVQCVIHDRGFLPPKPPAVMAPATEVQPEPTAGFGKPRPQDPKPKYDDEGGAKTEV